MTKKQKQDLDREMLQECGANDSTGCIMSIFILLIIALGVIIYLSK